DGREQAGFKPVGLDGRTGQAMAPGGSLGLRFGDDGAGRWNLDLGGIEPVLTLLGGAAGPGLAERGAAGPGLAERGAAGPGLAERGAAGPGRGEAEGA